jgi:hypothetical protein
MAAHHCKHFSSSSSSHNKYVPLILIPSLAIPTTKQWGKVDKATLHQLIVKDLSFDNINVIQARYFSHWQQWNF